MIAAAMSKVLPRHFPPTELKWARIMLAAAAPSPSLRMSAAHEQPFLLLDERAGLRYGYGRE